MFFCRRAQRKIVLIKPQTSILFLCCGSLCAQQFANRTRERCSSCCFCLCSHFVFAICNLCVCKRNESTVCKECECVSGLDNNKSDRCLCAQERIESVCSLRMLLLCLCVCIEQAKAAMLLLFLFYGTNGHYEQFESNLFCLENQQQFESTLHCCRNSFHLIYLHALHCVFRLIRCGTGDRLPNCCHAWRASGTGNYVSVYGGIS